MPSPPRLKAVAPEDSRRPPLSPRRSNSKSHPSGTPSPGSPSASLLSFLNENPSDDDDDDALLNPAAVVRRHGEAPTLGAGDSWRSHQNACYPEPVLTPHPWKRPREEASQGVALQGATTCAGERVKLQRRRVPPVDNEDNDDDDVPKKLSGLPKVAVKALYSTEFQQQQQPTESSLMKSIPFVPTVDCLINPGKSRQLQGMEGTVFFRNYVDRHMEAYDKTQSKDVFRFRLVLQFKKEERRRFFLLSKEKDYVLANDTVATRMLGMLFATRVALFRKKSNPPVVASISKAAAGRLKTSDSKPIAKPVVAPLKVGDRCAVQLLPKPDESPFDEFGRRKLSFWVPGIVKEAVPVKKGITVNVMLDSREHTDSTWTAGANSPVQRLVRYPNGLEYLKGSGDLCREPAPADLQAGDAVLCWFQQGQINSTTSDDRFQGRVASVDGKTCSVAYDDGDYEDEIPFLQKKPQAVVIRIAKGRPHPAWLVGMTVQLQGDEAIVKSVNAANGMVVLQVGKRREEKPYKDVVAHVMAEARSKANACLVWPIPHAVRAIDAPAIEMPAVEIPAVEAPMLEGNIEPTEPTDGIPAESTDEIVTSPIMEIPAAEMAKIPAAETGKKPPKATVSIVEVPTTPLPPSLKRQKSMTAHSGFLIGGALNSKYCAWGADLLHLSQSHHQSAPNQFLQGQIDHLLLNGPMVGETAFPDFQRMEVVNEVARHVFIPWAGFWVKVTQDLHTAPGDEIRTTDAALRRIGSSFHVKQIAAERLLERLKNDQPNCLAKEMGDCAHGAPGSFPAVIDALVSVWSKYSHFHFGTGWETNDGTTPDARSMASFHVRNLLESLGVLVSYAGKAYGARTGLDATGLAVFISGRIRLSPSVEVKHLKPCTMYPAGLTYFDYVCLVKHHIVLSLDCSTLPGVRRKLAQRLGVLVLYEAVYDY